MTNTNVTKGQVMPTNRSNTLERTEVRKRLTPRQVKIVNTKVQAELDGIPQKRWAQTIFPNATPRSAETLVSRELTKVDVNSLLEEALAKHKLNPESVVKVVGAGMKAKRVVGEKQILADDGTILKTLQVKVVDHNTRLKAAGMAARFMGIGNDPTEGGIHFHQHVGEKKQSYDD